MAEKLCFGGDFVVKNTLLSVLCSKYCDLLKAKVLKSFSRLTLNPEEGNFNPLTPPPEFRSASRLSFMFISVEAREQPWMSSPERLPSL